MSGPNYSRETFAPSEPTFAGDDPHSAGHNGTPPENVDETRPRTSFGVPGIGPAGGFEAHPIGSPPPRSMDEPGPSSDRHDGFGPPTLGGGPMQGRL